MTVIPLVVGPFGTVPEGLKKRLEELKISKKNRNHQYYSIAEKGQNTDKSPGDLRKITITQIPLKDQQLKLVWKFC